MDELLWAHNLEGELEPLAAQRVIGVQLLEMAVRNFNLLNDVMDRLDALEVDCEQRHCREEPQEPLMPTPRRGLTGEYKGVDGC